MVHSQILQQLIFHIRVTVLQSELFVNRDKLKLLDIEPAIKKLKNCKIEALFAYFQACVKLSLKSWITTHSANAKQLEAISIIFC